MTQWMTQPPLSRTDRRKAQGEDVRFRLLRALGADAARTQRALALETGVSLGAVNALLNGLIETGLVRVASPPHAAPGRLRIDYALTEAGRTEVTRLGGAYLQRRRAERDALVQEIAALEAAAAAKADRQR